MDCVQDAEDHRTLELIVMLHKMLKETTSKIKLNQIVVIGAGDPDIMQKNALQIFILMDII